MLYLTLSATSIRCTGEHHLKIWSYRRPSKEAPASLNYKACSVGVGKV